MDKKTILSIIGDLIEKAIELCGLKDQIYPDDDKLLEFIETRLCQTLIPSCEPEYYKEDMERTLGEIRERSEENLKGLLETWVNEFTVSAKIEEEWEKAKKRRKGLTKEEEQLLYG